MGLIDIKRLKLDDESKALLKRHWENVFSQDYINSLLGHEGENMAKKSKKKVEKDERVESRFHILDLRKD